MSDHEARRFRDALGNPDIQAETTGDTFTLGMLRRATADLPDDTPLVVGTPEATADGGGYVLCGVPSGVAYLGEGDDGAPGPIVFGFDLEAFVETRRLVRTPAARAA